VGVNIVEDSFAMQGFTSLEWAILAAICDATPELGPSVRRMLDTAKVTERDNTGHGFYTSFDVARSIPPLNVGLLDGPFAHMRDMGLGMTMGFILWFEAGYPDCLEGYQNCDDSGETVDLKTRSLDALAFERLEWFPASS
jgi:hypothetical protein